MQARTVRRAALLVLAAALAAPSAMAGGKDKEHESEGRRLKSPTEIADVPCRERARVYPDGRLAGCFLARDTEFEALRLPEGAWVEMDDEGRPDWSFLPRDTEIQGHVCRGKGHNFMTGFHPNGRLRLCWLAEAETIQGVTCRPTRVPGEIFRVLFGRGDTGTVFHDNGRLASCVLAEDAVVDGTPLKKGRRIRLDPEGRLAMQ